MKSLIIAISSLFLFLPSIHGKELSAYNFKVSYQKPVSEPAKSLQSPLKKTYADLVGNSYAWGNCTSWAADHADVINFLGNANEWWDNARAYGVPEGYAPKVGAVAQTSAGALGHVAVVEDVKGNSVLISEMNELGLGIVDERWVPADSFRYIYF